MEGQLRIMDQEEGDLKVIWDSEKQEEVDAAKEQFDKLIKKGYLAYKVGEKGKPSTQIKKFDPDLEKIIMSPQVVGG